MNNYNQNNHYNRFANSNCTSIDSLPLAMAYVPWQSWQNVYEPCKGLQMGTIFADLNFPFLGKRGVTQW